MDILLKILEIYSENLHTINIVTTIGIIGCYLGKKSFASKITSSSKSGSDRYFSHIDGLRILPLNRKGYSDRIAYLMAELSKLAYFKFENNDHIKIQENLISEIINKDKFTRNEAVSLIDDIVLQATSGRGNQNQLKKILAKQNFDLIKTYNVGSLQAYITKSNLKDKETKQFPFIVVAFRGSEKKVSDWLTNADAKPYPHGKKGLVHTGFYTSFKLIKKDLKEKLKEYPDCPIYFTGHSLGGALALLATRFITLSNIAGCYTFGAPRIGNYEFFFSVKTPVYRVVNSADIVPRVPPGVIFVKTLYWLCIFLKKITAYIPFISSTFDKISSFVDTLKDYRHFGDMRYLTDVTDGKFQNTQILSNPTLQDQMLWLWKGILAGITYPVKSHNMYIYTEKLAYIAKEKQKI